MGITLDSRLAGGDRKTAGKLQNACVGRFVVGIAVNAKSSLRTIALDDLATIYAGQVTSWKDVAESGQTTPIEIVGRTVIGTEGIIMANNVLHGRPFAAWMFDPSITPPAQKETDEQVIAALIKRPSAIGFLRYPPGGQLDKRVRVLGIVTTKGGKAVFPTAATVADGSYPLTDSLTLYLQPAAPQSAREFCKFAAGPDGAKIVKQCGLWPEYELNDVRGVKRLADVKAHRGVEVGISGSPAWQGMMKELGTEFSKAKTAVEIKYRAGTQYEAIGEFVGAEEKSEIRNPKSETNREENQNPKSETEGQGSQLLLIDSMLEAKTAHQYDAAWKVIKPTKVTLGWRAAAIVVHPTNPVSTISYRALRNVYGGQSKDWFDVVRAGSQERGAGSGEQGAKTAEQEAKAQALALFFGAIHLYGPPADDPISRLMETELGWKQHVKVLPRANIGKLIQTVARDPLAMGIVDLSQMPAGDASVKILAIGPSLPAGGTYSTLPQGYWLSQPVDLWVSAEAGQPAKDFAAFLASGECAATLQRHGLVPKVPAAKKAAVAAPAAGGKKGK